MTDNTSEVIGIVFVIFFGCFYIISLGILLFLGYKKFHRAASRNIDIQRNKDKESDIVFTETVSNPLFTVTPTKASHDTLLHTSPQTYDNMNDYSEDINLAVVPNLLDISSSMNPMHESDGYSLSPAYAKRLLAVLGNNTVEEYFIEPFFSLQTLNSCQLTKQQRSKIVHKMSSKYEASFDENLKLLRESLLSGSNMLLDLKYDPSESWISFARMNLEMDNQYEDILSVIHASSMTSFDDSSFSMLNPHHFGLDLSDCNISPDQLLNLLKLLNSDHPTKAIMNKLNLRRYPIQDLLPSFYQTISPSCIMELSLAGIKLSEEKVETLASFIRYNSIIESLDLSECSLDRVGCFHIASCLGDVAVDPKVAAVIDQRQQNSSSNTKSSKGTKNINLIIGNYTFIQFNSSLRKLVLVDNEITSYGAHDLSRALLNNQSLQYLDVSFQVKSKKIGPMGAREFASLLRKNKSLLTFRCARNNIGFEGCRHLASAMYHNSSLTELDIGHVNYITIAGAMQLAQAILYNKSSRLSWLTVGEHRLPVAALIGDKQYFNYLSDHKENIDKHRETQHNTNTNSPSGLKHFGRKIKKIAHKLLPVIHLQPLDDEIFEDLELGGSSLTNDRNLEWMFDLQYRHSSLYPKILSIPRSSGYARQSSQQFTSVSNHGMHDEVGVVIGTLLQPFNRNLQYLRLEKTFLPIQQLIGSPHSKRYLNLANQQLTSIDTVVIGILVSENPFLYKLHLKDNSFAESEGECYIAFALERNQKLSLDLQKWPVAEMFRDGYRTLASRNGLSASGVIIEPQRLEGWFYQGLTGISACLFYFTLYADIQALRTFIQQPEIYLISWSIIEGILMGLPTILYAYNTFRYLVVFDVKQAIIQTSFVIFQLTSLLQAYDCITNAKESTAMLDFKYVTGVYKSIPQTYFKSFIMFYVALHSNQYDIWVLVSILTSIISMTVIFIMQFDRKEARRMAMAPIIDQPLCAIYIANLLTFFGMGKDTDYVEDFINFDSYYTSHYVWSYVYQILSIYARIVSISWVIAIIPIQYQLMFLYILIWIRLMILCLVDNRFFEYSLYRNIIKALSLVISDSAWSKDENDRKYSQRCFLLLCILTTCENLIAIICSLCFYSYIDNVILSQDTIKYLFGMFLSVVIAISWRWLMIYHWLLHIHFPEMYVSDVNLHIHSNIDEQDEIVLHEENSNTITNISRNIKLRFGWNPRSLILNR